MSVRDMTTRVKQLLQRNGVEPPGPDAMLAALNGAKDYVAGLAINANPEVFAQRQDVSVTAGDASIDLPVGMLRLIGATVVDATSGDESHIEIVDPKADHRIDYGRDEACLRLTHEGSKLYFEDGKALRSMTIRLRYVTLPADLTTADQDSTIEKMPQEWRNCVVYRATLELLPGNNSGRGAVRDEFSAHAALLTSTAQKRIDHRPRRIRRVR